MMDKHEETIRDMVAEGRTDRAIAKSLGVSRSRVGQLRERYGLAGRRARRPGLILISEAMDEFHVDHKVILRLTHEGRLHPIRGLGWGRSIFLERAELEKVLREVRACSECGQPRRTSLGLVCSPACAIKRKRLRRYARMGREVPPFRPRFKLTAEQVAEIRASSESCREVAARFGVCESTVYQIMSGRLWRQPRVRIS